MSSQTDQQVLDNIRKQKHLKVLNTMQWTFPMQRVEIHMNTVIRSQMDVLMKMMLKIFNRLDIKAAVEISELLSVEMIFIEHMLILLERSEMIEKEQGIYRLTANGTAQLEAGTFTHEPVEETMEVTYSPFHQRVLKRQDEQETVGRPKEMPTYRYETTSELSSFEKQDDVQVKQMIEDSGYEFLVEEGQKLINDILSLDVKDVVQARCFEIHLHDQTDDTVYIQVWNTWTARFDERFEEELNRKEASELRERLVSSKGKGTKPDN